MAEHVGIEPTHRLLSDRLAICCLNRSASVPYVVRRERLELSILSALASKTSVYTIPPPTHYVLISTTLPLILSTSVILL